MVARWPRASSDVVHEARQELHRHVLEGERRAVEQLEHEEVGADLRERAAEGWRKVA